MNNPNLFQTGVHPMTGEKAIRTSVYELLKQIEGVEFSPHDIVGLVPSVDPNKVKDALRGLVQNPSVYPGVHRVGRGRYLFDPSRPQEWMTFPNMARRRKVGNRVVRVASTKPSKAVKKNPVTEALANKVEARVVAVQQAEAIIADAQRLGQFVEVIAMFDRSTGKFLPMNEAVLLRDEDGCFWQATKV